MVTDLSRVPNAVASKGELKVNRRRIPVEKTGEVGSSSEDESSSEDDSSGDSEESSSESSEESSSESSDESSSEDGEECRSGEKKGSVAGNMEETDFKISSNTGVL